MKHYVHIIIDTCSGFIFASSRSEETMYHIIDHYLSTIVVMGKLFHIKTDNSLGYISTAFKAFCSSYQILHTTGISYNPHSQTIVEWAHYTLKLHLCMEAMLKSSLYSYPYHN
jgi:transposase InsO family protein